MLLFSFFFTVLQQGEEYGRCCAAPPFSLQIYLLEARWQQRYCSTFFSAKISAPIFSLLLSFFLFSFSIRFCFFPLSPLFSSLLKKNPSVYSPSPCFRSFFFTRFSLRKKKSFVPSFSFFFFTAPLPFLFLFLLLLLFLIVQGLLSITGRKVAVGGGSSGCGRTPRWRKKQREEQLLGTRTKYDFFFLTSDPRSSLSRT